MSPEINSRIFYRGPSQLDQAPIIGVITGLATPSTNTKTGDMRQTYILREDLPPPEAVRLGLDRSICGDCALRGDGNGLGRACYVQTKWAPLSIWKLQRDRAKDWRQIDYLRDRAAIPALSIDRTIRLGTYGDPTAIPMYVWEWRLATTKGHTGYTHQWRDARFRDYRAICMASVDSDIERSEAVARGWRTFRVREASQPLSVREITCPASAEAGHKTTCAQCRLCDGTRAGGFVRDPRKDITIVAHGSRAQKVGTQVLPFEEEWP